MTESLTHITNEHIRKIAHKYHYNFKLCAEKLGISKGVLGRKAKLLNIEFYKPVVAVKTDAIHLRNTPNNGFSAILCRQRSNGWEKEKHKVTNLESEVTCRRCLKKLEVMRWTSKGVS